MQKLVCSRDRGKAIYRFAKIISLEVTAGGKRLTGAASNRRDLLAVTGSRGCDDKPSRAKTTPITGEGIFLSEACICAVVSLLLKCAFIISFSVEHGKLCALAVTLIDFNV